MPAKHIGALFDTWRGKVALRKWHWNSWRGVTTTAHVAVEQLVLVYVWVSVHSPIHRQQ